MSPVCSAGARFDCADGDCGRVSNAEGEDGGEGEACDLRSWRRAKVETERREAAMAAGNEVAQT